jgi:glucose-6-phosphate 1-epimerase
MTAMPLRATPTTFDSAGGPVPCIDLARGAARARVALQGAQALSWVPARGGERLFHGTATRYGAGRGIRAGIPVIFPQFADRGPLARHGWARTSDWTFLGVDAEDGVSSAVFALDDDDASRTMWPHRYALRLRVGLDADTLRVALDVRNGGDTPFDFACALHSYLRVASLAATRLDGVAGRRYRDRAAGGAETIDRSPSPRFDGEVDRTYLGCAGERLLSDGTTALRIETSGFGDTVVWNPGAALAADLADLAPGEHDRFVCVEPACVEPRIRLAAGAIWRGTLRMTACDLVPADCNPLS